MNSFKKLYRQLLFCQIFEKIICCMFDQWFLHLLYGKYHSAKAPLVTFCPRFQNFIFLKILYIFFTQLYIFLKKIYNFVEKTSLKEIFQFYAFNYKFPPYPDLKKIDFQQTSFSGQNFLPKSALDLSEFAFQLQKQLTKIFMFSISAKKLCF